MGPYPLDQGRGGGPGAVKVDDESTSSGTSTRVLLSEGPASGL